MAAVSDSVRTLGELLERRAAEHGDETFFRYQDTEFSYEEIDSRANAIANRLLSSGVTAGDAVCLYMYNRPEYLYAVFALAKIGAVAAPIDTRFTGETLEYVLSATDADVVILDADTESAYRDVRGDTTTISTEFFAGEGDPDQPYRDFDLLLSGDGSAPPDVDVGGSDTCSVIYVQRYRRTHPQGVTLPHYSYINTGRESCRDLLDLARDDCIFTTLPFYSSYPMQMGVTGALISGATFAFQKQFDGERFWEWTRKYDATVFLYLGRMLSVLYNREEHERDDETPVTHAVGHGFGFGSDETMIANFERRFDVTVLEAYGITPSSTLATSNRPGDRRLGSVGKPVSYAEIKIVDEDDWEVPTGQTGEILIRPTTPNTMLRGFDGDDELTVEVCRNQWIHTNDVGYVDEDGYLYFVASKTNTIHLGRVAGRISSLEIETVIDTHPAVRESAVFGVATGNDDEAIKAVVVPEEGARLSPIDVSEHCEKQLTYHKLPRYVEIRENLPRSPAGKVRKDQLLDTEAADVWDRERGYDLNR
ncbi:class I adenylate-forming enzyme family protein [Halomarina pelagica]|uniref:class I adenylate-forming enzyme family protein n=1 Tax=Halomarina pelagica TaxID=2961599 RepID=UPI0020C5A655|nr:AMP-binding protein [Halomarina sp. BND7]